MGHEIGDEAYGLVIAKGSTDKIGSSLAAIC